MFWAKNLVGCSSQTVSLPIRKHDQAPRCTGTKIGSGVSSQCPHNPTSTKHSLLSDLVDHFRDDIPAIWRRELLKLTPNFDRSSWPNRLNPLDVLRCAAFYLDGHSPHGLPSAADEKLALHAIIHFLLLTPNKPFLAVRRAQAILCALELAVKHREYETALDVLLIFLREKRIPVSASWASIILLPRFGPFFIRLVAHLNDSTSTNPTASISDAIPFDLQ